MKKLLLIFLLVLMSQQIFSQDDLSDLASGVPKKYTIKGLTVTGNETIDEIIVVAYSGLALGSEIYIPGDKINQAIKNLWKQRLFSFVKIYATKVIDNDIYLLIEVKTRPRLSKYIITGVSKSEVEKLKEEISLVRGEIVTNQTIQIVNKQIKDYFVEKGYYNPEIVISQEPDSLFGKNSIKLGININKNNKIRIGEVSIIGDSIVSERKIRMLLKKTKQYQKVNVFRSSKYIDDLFEEDKARIITHYNSLGYRDAKITSDSIKLVNNEYLQIKINIYEGDKYFFREITWTGNSKYNNDQLNLILGIKNGDVYNPELLDQKLNMSPSGIDISSLYMDNGYLFFSVTPIEKTIESDSIDLEIRIFEGPPAIISEVTISGNLRTSDHVILRELRTRPGDLFSRADIIRSQRELAQLGYFDPEQMNVIPTPNPEDGTVGIEYVLVEKPSDQFQLQGGWGGKQFVGSAGFVFNNFSSKKLFDPKAWGPLPSGDGQRLSFSFQSNAVYFSSLNLSFTEPWFGGKKPNSLSISVYRSFQSNGVSKGEPTRQEINIAGATVGLGKRLKVPDDYFTLYNAITFQRYNLDNYQSEFSFTDGFSNNLNFKHVLSRNSVDQPIYPRSGSNFTLTTQWTPPYSLFSNKDYSGLSQQEKFKWNEYHKWRFDASWFINIVDKLVLNTKFQFGYLGMYNRDIGITPFERFYVGGSGLSGYHLDGRDLIALRGYEDQSLTAENNNEKGGTIFNKYTFELRYPLSLNQSATIYALVFAEAGNSWLNFKEYNPFKINRSLGAGVRIFMPMFGLLGFDWGYGFDEVPGKAGVNGSQFHVSIGQEF